MGIHQPIRKTVAPEIPDKLYFRIGDVARLCEVPAYVLRFWETEFPQLRPNKGGTGQRLYRKRDVEMALRIKSLLYDQGYTIPGARQVFKSEAKPREAAVLPLEPASAPIAQPSGPAIPMESPGFSLQRDRQVQSVRAEMRSLLSMLSRPVSAAHPSIEGKIKAMRPRLVLERSDSAAALSPPGFRRLQLEQRDLFGNDSAAAFSEDAENLE